MKKISFILGSIILGLTSNYLIAQGSWALQTNPLGKAMLGKIQFVSATEGWISVQNGARLLHTTNAGTNWSVVTMNANDTVTSISDPAMNLSFSDPLTGWVLKSFGTDFQDAFGAVIYKTSNGGVNWQRTVLSNSTSDLAFQLQVIDANGWASIFNFESNTLKIFKTSNAGNSWNMISETEMMRFKFVNSADGWAINYDPSDNPAPPYKIFRSSNGGASWTTQFTDTTLGKFNDIYFTDQNNGWVVGEKGKILHTSNGGASWTYITNTGINSQAFSKCVFFLDANYGWIGYGNENTEGVLATKDGGATWKTQSTPVTNDIFSISFYNATHGWLTSDYGQIAKYDAPVVSDTIPNFGFENWINNNQPNQWLVRGTTASKSTDKLAGNYALKLQTTSTPGTINTLPPNGLEGFQPSFPVSERHITLNGYYKFSPVNSDSCQFYIILSKKGYVNPLGYDNFVGWGNLCKGASNTYAPFAVPITYFDNSTIPDSAWICLNAYKDFDFITMTNGSPFGNSTLHVDNLAFDEFTVSNWKGIVSDAWENPANWSSGVVPSSTTKVFINTGTPYSLVVRSNASCQSLNISAGANISVTTGYTITINGR